MLTAPNLSTSKTPPYISRTKKARSNLLAAVLFFRSTSPVHVFTSLLDMETLNFIIFNCYMT